MSKFVFVAPMYNASQHLSRMLHSICGQSYENWRLILIDDVSSPEEVEKSKRIIHGFQELLDRTDKNPNKISIVWNEDEGRGKQWEVSNVLHGISQCEDDDIICRIDADDWLTDIDALPILDASYEQLQCDALWTMHRWSFSDKNISGPMDDNADPYRHPWVASHLKTFRKHLINGVKDENFRGEDGNYIRRAGDQAIYLPVLHKAKRRAFLPRCMYHYTIKDVPETYQTNDAVFQRDEALFLRSRGFVQ